MWSIRVRWCGKFCNANSLLRRIEMIFYFSHSHLQCCRFARIDCKLGKTRLKIAKNTYNNDNNIASVWKSFTVRIEIELRVLVQAVQAEFRYERVLKCFWIIQHFGEHARERKSEIFELQHNVNRKKNWVNKIQQTSLWSARSCFSFLKEI